MNSNEIESNVKRIFENFSKEEFPFDLLLAYGISKTSITRLKKGDFNLSKTKGEILYKKKIFFKEEATGSLLSSIDSIAKDESIIKHKPRFAIVTDFKTLVAKDLKLGKNLDIPINDLPKYYGFFSPLAGSEVYHSANDNEADRNAAYKMADLYDLLIHENPDIYNSKETVHNLNVFLSRLLFCFFAEDTEIFDEESIFTNTLAQHTLENGSDTNLFLNRLFDRLNAENGKGFPEHFAKFPYVNGGLFKDLINSPVFTAKARKILVALGELNWKHINPDIFGSMIQAVVIPEYRSDLGMHYTSVPNILKLIRPLFLDELYEIFEKQQNNSAQLRKLIQRIAQIKFFDPACGSGNFLIITYKEIRLLEIKIIQQIIALEKIGLFTDSFTTSVSLNQFYGIELDDFAHEMAILSLWLAEHQMNRVFDEMLEGYGASKPILPLKEAGKIAQGNAARVSWEEVCPKLKDGEIYIIGNPPYQGYSKQDKEQRKDMDLTFYGIKGYKKLDYIACWFYKAALYIQNSSVKYAFVTTNSITQGEQVALLWPLILNKNQEIGFAHQSFKWTNNAKGNAGVAVVIISIRNVEDKEKFLYNKNIKLSVKNINPYLINYDNLIIKARGKSISNFPEMIIGSKISDNGNLLLESAEKNKLVLQNPKTEKFLKKYIGAKEFVNSRYRYCIHITKETESEAYKIEEFVERFERVKSFRYKSKKEATNRKAGTPHFFDEDKHEMGEFILVPQTGSEKREYVPIGYFDDSYVPSNATRVIYNAQPWLFGIVSSKMHIVWVKAVAGRLKTDMQYSNTLCYNTFPFPNITLKQQENLNLYVMAILDERAKHSAYTFPLSNYPSNLAESRIAGENNQVSEVTRQSDEKTLYKLKIDENTLQRRNITAPPTEYAKKRMKESMLTEMKPAILPPVAPGVQPSATDSVDKKQEAIFQTEFGVEENDSVPIKTNPGQIQQVAITPPKAAENPLSRAKLFRYKPLKFSADFGSAAFNSNVLVNRYQPYMYGSGPIMLNSGTVLNGLIKLGTADLMEDIRINGAFKIGTNLKDNEWFLNFQNLKKRIDWGLTYYRNAQSIDFPDTVTFTYLPVRNITNLYQGNISYPFDEARSIRFSTGIRIEKQAFKVIDGYTLGRIDQRQFYSISRLEYIYDNSLNPSMNIWNGLRYKIYGEYNRQLNKNTFTEGASTFNVGFDARYYYPIYRDFIWAGRAAGDFSWGKQKFIYYLGGVDGWLMFGNNQKSDGSYRYFNEAVRPANDNTYSFQSLAVNMRGFLQNVANGNNALVINSELRLPVFSIFFDKIPNNSFLRNFQLTQFIDLGTAWNGAYDGIKRPEIVYGNVNDPNTVLVKAKAGGIGPFAGGYGFGARSTLLGYFIKFDAGWPMSGFFNSKPILYLALGFDF